MNADTRTNEQIIAEAIGDRYGHAPDFYNPDADAVVAALAAAGRLR